ncbi:MAG TPA: hypothetical protein DCE56_29865 [Cyanobacteria bacterium UBA8553]|nr:hypothetical protein [Cyanobacteria bacterium UBA8553]HAJ63604.1 hypothetical protein [Cyanobacteria bacterium UBA8543]
MSELDNPIHPNEDREHLRQKALTQYRLLKSLKKSELSLDDKIFIENFEVAMLHIWGVKNTSNSVKMRKYL